MCWEAEKREWKTRKGQKKNTHFASYLHFTLHQHDRVLVVVEDGRAQVLLALLDDFVLGGPRIRLGDVIERGEGGCLRRHFFSFRALLAFYSFSLAPIALGLVRTRLSYAFSTV